MELRPGKDPGADMPDLFRSNSSSKSNSMAVWRYVLSRPIAKSTLVFPLFCIR